MRRSAGPTLLLVAVAILACLSQAGPASAQGCFPMTCDDPNQSSPAQGQGIGGDSDVNTDDAESQPGVAGQDGSDNADGQNSGGEDGTSQAGQPGSSGRPQPPAPPPPRRTTTTRRSTTTGTGTATGTGTRARTTRPSRTSDAGALSSELMPSPTPSPEPSPSPTESPSPTPTAKPRDLVTALQDADPASEDGSLVPFFAIVAGAILLFVYLRSRRPSRRRGMRSTGRRGGSHSIR